ncbi:MAG: lipoate--protein ligase family protein [Cyanosarcina radialis HA8281-LM2]|nr:lipoate--protein ligase family protein [Cyanosarcina radialis HA8281-LM2]
MAIDLWLIERHLQGLHPPTLRFYTWSPPAISLGYHQHRYPEFWQDLTWQGMPVELVRRPTGGRAVLHQGDLTYAVVTSGLKGSRLQVYETICEFLLQGWRRLGLELHYGTAGRGYIDQPNCFGTATGADLVLADGTKFIGSAQLRRGDGILQHGSMRLTPDVNLLERVFGEASLPVPRIDIAIDTIVDTLAQAAASCFEVQLVTNPLSEAEWQLLRDRTDGNRPPM